MPQIACLPPHVANLIAAGEVVERPASVVKELVENAVDAGATAVVVEIRGGGMSLIRVTDNGCGIAPEELPTAFLRHATSKLREEKDLAQIGTLGFRGEALAAVAAVSRLDIISRPREAETGASLHLEGGVPGEVIAAGAPAGTTLLIRDLFYNTPARLKFMKKDTAESAAVGGLMEHLALSHPEISFKYIKDGQETLHTPGDGKLLSAVYAALGRDFARGLLEVKGRGGEVEVTGYLTKPLFGRGSRSMQVFFVNGRFIKSQLLTAALEEGYRNQLMKGKFPGCVLSVTLPVTAVDVNVHPAKTVVKFAREHDVFDAVYHTVLDALDGDRQTVTPEGRPVGETVNPRADFFRAMDAKTYRGQESGPKTPAPKVPAWDTELGGKAQVRDAAPAAPVYRTAAPSAPAGKGTAGSPFPALREKEPFVPAIPAAVQEQIPLPVRNGAAQPKSVPWRIAGEVLKTYIVCEDEEETVWLIDKHAAHERILFDRLQAGTEPVMRQQLIAPVAAELSREDGALLLGNLPLLEEFGFACEDFGDGALLVREVPADLDPADVPSTLEELAENLRAGRSPEEKREHMLHTMACKAAVKAGMHSDERELRVLADRVQSGEIKYCPHGRPVAVKLTKYELEKMFHRA